MSPRTRLRAAGQDFVSQNRDDDSMYESREFRVPGLEGKVAVARRRIQPGNSKPAYSAQHNNADSLTQLMEAGGINR